LVTELWNLFDRHCHDDLHGGYIELRRDDWSSADQIAGYFTRDPRTKTLAVQLHVLEALTAYLDAGNGADSTAAERLHEIIVLLSTNTASTPERLGHERFLADWSPDSRSRRRRYGHDAELIWMLHDGCRVLGQPVPVALLRERFDEILRLGYDHREGGFFTGGPAGEHADHRTKPYWAQAEGLLAALRLHTLTGDASYGRCYLRTLDWIEQRQADWVGGDWYERIDARGRPAGVKASTWKEPYHHGRALIECIEALERRSSVDGVRGS
jgi:mannobiose 2-epimerase